jgi:hypothetical protein
MHQKVAGGCVRYGLNIHNCDIYIYIYIYIYIHIHLYTKHQHQCAAKFPEASESSGGLREARSPLRGIDIDVLAVTFSIGTVTCIHGQHQCAAKFPEASETCIYTYIHTYIFTTVNTNVQPSVQKHQTVAGGCESRVPPFETSTFWPLLSQ